MSAHTAPGSPRRPLRTVLLMLAALLPVVGLLVVSPTASATHNAQKVTFCHATSSRTNPYVSITTDPASIIKVGHDHHSGPVWSPTMGTHASWGDVIPAFTWVDRSGRSHHYAGLNTDHLDVVAAGCVVPPTQVELAAPVAADQTCDATGTITIEARQGVTWTLDEVATTPGTHDVAAGSHTVTATALRGWTIVGPSTWTLTVAAATECGVVTVTPVDPTVTPPAGCGLQGGWTVPATEGVSYLLDGVPVTAGDHSGPVKGTVTATALPGYRLSDPGWSFALDVPAAEACPEIVVVTPVAPTVVPSPRCGVQGSVTVPATEGLRYLLDGQPFAAGTHDGPLAGTVTAEALEGYTLEDAEWSVTISVPAAEACPVIVVVTPVDPTVTPSTECGVEGTYAIPSTTGVEYLLEGTPIAAGTYDGPASGTVTATAAAGYTLADAEWSYELSLAAADTCTLPSTGGESLAETGGDPGPMAGLAALLLALGAGLVVATTRRPTTR